MQNSISLTAPTRCACQTMPNAVAGEHVFRASGRDVARISPEGRIRYIGQAATPVPDLGYNPPLPSDRLLSALSALLAQDLTQAHGVTVSREVTLHA